MSEPREMLQDAAKLMSMGEELRLIALQDRILALQSVYGSCRAVGKALNIDHAYLARLRDGEKTRPSQTVLRKLGLQE